MQIWGRIEVYGETREQALKRIELMSYKPPYQQYKDRQRKRKVYTPIILGGLAIIMVAAGIVLIWMWFRSSGGVEISMLNTDTPTPTETNTPVPPTETPTETLFPTETLTATPAPTSTAAAPFLYEVESGDTIFSIAEKFDVSDWMIIMVLNNMSADDFLFVGQQLIIPDPNTALPSPTPIPQNLPAGTAIEYMVLSGDTLQIIAEKFLSTEDAIIEENGITDPNTIFPGQILLVPIRLITPTFGAPPTASPTASP
jgi:LysM repeat protein